MIHSWSKADKIWDDPGVSCYAKVYGSAEKDDGDMSQDIASSKGFHLPNLGQFELQNS